MGQCRGVGVTETCHEKEFGSMQMRWNDRNSIRKLIWVNAEVLE
ncbi:hypothetical protein [Neobacillus sp. CF12]|nr:hypothetical protein [Neobacillus sp. CF12]MDM5327187.1 hypothetical protein [Neobacillus sp. CF12]